MGPKTMEVNGEQISAETVLIVGVNRLNTSNFHALLRTFKVKLNLTILKSDCICKDGVVKES